MICDKRRRLYLTRVEKFMKRVADMIVGPTVEMDATFGHSVEPTPFGEHLALTYKSIKEGETWGAAWESAWFRLRGNVPAGWAGKKVVAQMDFNSEAMVFGEDGTPIQGLRPSPALRPTN
jgi:alpha-mannosidase